MWHTRLLHDPRRRCVLLAPISLSVLDVLGVISLPLRRPLKTKERAVPRLGRRSKQRRRDLPVVVLGILPRLLPHCHKWLHRQSTKLCPPQSSRRSQPRLSPHPRAPVQLLPDGVRVRHRSHSHGRPRRTRSRLPGHALHLHMDNTRLLPHRVLGLERQRLGLQVGCPRLCRCAFLRATLSYSDRRWQAEVRLR